LRVRKLLKRFLATPMRRSDFLLSIVLSRIVFSLVDAYFLIAVGYFLFDVKMQGNWFEMTIAILLGTIGFGGIGLLVASRAKSLETVSGLMNLIILPMWIFSGIFFSSERFPESIQPVVNLLPLTGLNQMLRGVMLEGQSILAFWRQVLIMLTYGIVPFFIALKIFRWK
jgi:ABC-type multidrug transport system permease subunit